MPNVVDLREWDEQPQYPVSVSQDLSSKMGLQVLVCPSISNSNLLNNVARTLIGTPTDGVGVDGRSRVYSATADKYPTPASLDTLTSYTIFQFARYNKTGAFPGLISKQRGAEEQALEIWQNDTVFNIQHTGTSVAITGLDAALSTSKAQGMVFTWDGTNFKSFIDGRLISTVTQATAITAGNGTFIPLSRVAAVSSAGEYYLGGIGNRCLSEAEAIDFSKNLWQIFEPETDYIYFPSAGGGPTPNWLQRGYWWDQSYGNIGK